VSTTSRARKPLRKCGEMSKFPQLARAVLAATFIFGTIPTLAILVDQPAAMATPLSSEEPPQPPKLTDKEQQALDDKAAGRLRSDQKGDLNSAEQKVREGEKYTGERNKQKRDNNRRGGGRRR
jgi:hypothetical protein